MPAMMKPTDARGLRNVARYGTPNVIDPKHYAEPHPVFMLSALAGFLRGTENKLHTAVAAIDGDRRLTDEGKRHERAQLAAKYLPDVDKVVAQENVVRDLRATLDKLKAERKVPPVDPATRTWIWDQIKGRDPVDVFNLMLHAVDHDDHETFEAIRQMPRQFNPVGPDLLAKATAAWDAKNMAGATEEERDMRAALDTFMAEAERVRSVVRAEAGMVEEPALNRIAREGK